jgi:hypothetical protein
MAWLHASRALIGPIELFGKAGNGCCATESRGGGSPDRPAPQQARCRSDRTGRWVEPIHRSGRTTNFLIRQPKPKPSKCTAKSSMTHGVRGNLQALNRDGDCRARSPHRNGSRECVPDDKLCEAIQQAASSPRSSAARRSKAGWAPLAALLKLTGFTIQCWIEHRITVPAPRNLIIHILPTNTSTRQRT